MTFRFFNNAYYARVGGVSTRELNKLEMKFLFSLDFRLHVSVQTFGKYCSMFKKEANGGLIERSIQVCGVEESWTNKDDPTCAQSVARWGSSKVYWNCIQSNRIKKETREIASIGLCISGQHTMAIGMAYELKDVLCWQSKKVKLRPIFFHWYCYLSDLYSYYEYCALKVGYG